MVLGSLIKSYIRSIGLVEPISLGLIRESSVSIRKTGDVSELKASISRRGLIEPIVVRQVEDFFEIIAGNRRYEAFRQLGLSEIPCVIRKASDQEAFELALIENVQRETLSSLEEAQAFKKYVVDHGWGSVSELARRIGKSEEYVSHRILLLELPESVKQQISGRQLKPSTARELIWLKDEGLQEKISKAALTNNFSVKRVRKIVKLVKSGASLEKAMEITDDSQAEPTVWHDSQGKTPRYTKEVIVTLRMALVRVDFIISTINDSNDKKRIMELRFRLHQLLDEAISLSSA